MGQVRLATRRKIGIAIVLAALASLVVTYFYKGHVAEERLAEFNRQNPDFMKRNWALKETGPRNRLGLEVTESVGLFEIKAVWGPGEQPTPYEGSAVVNSATPSVATGQVWELVDGKARLLWSPNPYWLVTTDPVPVGVAVASLAIAIYFALPKARGKTVRAMSAPVFAIGVASLAMALVALGVGLPADIWGTLAGVGVLLSGGAFAVSRALKQRYDSTPKVLIAEPGAAPDRGGIK